MPKPVFVLPLKRTVRKLYDADRDLYCIIGAQDRKWSRVDDGYPWAASDKQSAISMRIFRSTAYYPELVNDGDYETQVHFLVKEPRLTSTERTMLLAFLAQAAGYTVKVIEA